MRELYELKEKILAELKKYSAKQDISASGLETIDKLAHAAKNIDKIIMEAENGGEYSGHWGPMYYAEARGRGSNAQRDSMGRYSSEGNRGGNYMNEGGNYSGRYSSRGYSRSSADMIDELRDMMEETQDPKLREDISRLVSKMERQ